METGTRQGSAGAAGGTAGGSLPSGGGYSRRSLPGEPKTADRQRLLTDRNAYIAYLESQVQRANDAALEAESAGAGLRQIRERVEDLEEKARSTARAMELAQEHSARAGAGARATRQEVEEQLRLVDGRVQRLERALGDEQQPRLVEGRVQRLELSIGEARTNAEAEMARLRNEVSLALQELGQRLDARFQALRERVDERVQALRAAADDGAASVIREAQVTCVRLADDAMGATEASQKKVEDLARQSDESQKRLEDFSRRTEVSLDVLRADLAAVHAELASALQRVPPAPAPPAPAPVPAAPVPVAPAMSASVAPPLPAAEDVNELAEALERRLATRLGNQVLQLTDALRRVVQAQTVLHRQLGGSQALIRSPSATLPVPPILGFGGACGAVPNSASVSEAQRRSALDELYRELRQLEEQGTDYVSASAAPTARASRPKGAARRAARA